MGKRQVHTSRKVETPSPDSDRYIRWRNETGRLLEPIELDNVTINDWTPWRVISLSPSATKKAEGAGLTRIGLAAP